VADADRVHGAGSERVPGAGAGRAFGAGAERVDGAGSGCQRVCVTGLGLVSALGTTVDATYAALRAGNKAERALDTFGCDAGLELRGHPIGVLDAAALAVSRGQLRYMSPAMRYLYAATREALVQAGLAGEQRCVESLGIAIGAHTGERTSRSELQALRAGTDAATGRTDPVRYAEALLARSPLSALRAQPGLLAGLLSELHGTKGPCLTVIDAAVAGGRAIEEACQAVADGWCQAWIAGASFDLDDPWLLLAHGRTPPSLGSAAAVLVLESSAAVRRRGAAALAAIRVEASPVGSSGRTGSASEHAVTLDASWLASRIGDTLAAAVPVSLVLGIRHLMGVSDRMATPDATAAPEDAPARTNAARLTITAPGLATAFVIESVARATRDAAPLAAEVRTAHDGIDPQAGALGDC
jgi:hypothetical protein